MTPAEQLDSTLKIRYVSHKPKPWKLNVSHKFRLIAEPKFKNPAQTENKKVDGKESWKKKCTFLVVSAEPWFLVDLSVF